jgi:hypothetical protein
MGTTSLFRTGSASRTRCSGARTRLAPQTHGDTWNSYTRTPPTALGHVGLPPASTRESDGALVLRYAQWKLGRARGHGRAQTQRLTRAGPPKTTACQAGRARRSSHSGNAPPGATLSCIRAAARRGLRRTSGMRGKRPSRATRTTRAGAAIGCPRSRRSNRDAAPREAS